MCYKICFALTNVREASHAHTRGGDSSPSEGHRSVSLRSGDMSPVRGSVLMKMKRLFCSTWFIFRLCDAFIPDLSYSAEYYSSRSGTWDPQRLKCGTIRRVTPPPGPPGPPRAKESDRARLPRNARGRALSLKGHLLFIYCLFIYFLVHRRYFSSFSDILQKNNTNKNTLKHLFSSSIIIIKTVERNREK